MFDPIILRRISSVVLLAFTSLTLQPLQAVAQTRLTQANSAQTSTFSADERYARLLNDIQDGAKRGAGKANKGQSTRSETQTLRQQAAQLLALQPQIEQSFSGTAAQLGAANISTEILARHNAALAQYQARQSEFKRLLRTLEDADDHDDETHRASGLQNLSTWLEQNNNKKKTHTPIDPAKLPWGSPKATPRMPAETKTAWYQNLTKDYRVQLAQASGLTTVGGIQFTHPPEPTQVPQNADLTETPDIQLTPAIRAKALELGNNPVTIANWVRNTIQYLPTWGSIQGTDGTLKTLRGNAFDTASLTIALLRASSIPARYQFGTIDLPAEQAMNWVGGVQKPEAALNLMYQGGIAARGLITGGRITTIRMEHVWVNAYVNWTPSRGNKQGGGASTPKITTPDGVLQHVNPNANLNAWVPLDASYKQYSYTQGMDLKTAVPLDANALLTAAQQGATVTSSYAQNLNQANLQTQLAGYQNRLKAYINSTPTGAGSTVDDVLGSQRIQTRNYALLAGTLPYAIVANGSERAEVPDGLRWKVKMYGYELDATGGPGVTLIQRSFNLLDLVNRRVGITYEGATPADQAAIANYRIGGATSFPAYVLRVKPLLQIDGSANIYGESAGMGRDVEWRVNVIPAGQSEASGNEQTYGAAAGDETIWSFVADSVTAAQLKSISFPNTPAGQLHAVGMSYWHQVDAYAKLIAQREGAIVQRMPSLGAISSGLRVQFIWGIPRNASYLGRTMDIGHSAIGVQGMDGAVFQRELGMRASYLEGDIFDQVFSRETGTSLSAARLLQTAMESGQRVFTLNSANADHYMGQIQMSPAVREEIINALIMGLEVTIPEFTQDINGWQGTGYIAIRPETGAGSYIISGGQRGGAEGADCQLQPSTNPANATNFSPAVMFAAAIIAAYLIASIFPVIVPVALVLVAMSQSAAAAPVPQLPTALDVIWKRLQGGRPWPTQFNWPPAGIPNAGPPGMCTVQQHAALEAEKDLACEKPSSCKGTDTCAEVDVKVQNKTGCISARLAVMDICFQGGDERHWRHLEQELKGMLTCESCKAKLLAAQQCTGGN